MADPSEGREWARQEFEKWGNAKGAHVEKSWNGEFYENKLVESAWQGWQARGEQERWISVEERLPDEDGRYIVAYRYRGSNWQKLWVADYSVVDGWLTQLENVAVEHWTKIELPAPPVPKGDS